MKYTYFVFLFLFFVFTQNVNCQSTVTKTLYFNVDDHSLTKSSQETLLNLVSELQSSNESDIQIIGHTDQDGTLEYNMQLSQKRANSVKQFLVDSRYSPSDIKLSYHGESDLLSSGKDQESKQKNRRVTVIANALNYSSVSDFVSLLKTEGPDKFVVDHRDMKKVHLSEGTSVTIPSNAFCYMDGSPLNDDLIELNFKEAFDYIQMVDERLSTNTDNSLLETGGMIYIEATQNGMPLKLQDGKEIELLFPEQGRKDGMELFTGVDTEDGVIWEETGQKISEVKEEPFIQVDLSPIVDFQFVFQDTVELPFENMLPYPKAQRMPHPPAKVKYSEEKYAELYGKYEVLLAEFRLDEKEIPKQLAIWNEELARRKKLLIQHKVEHTQAHVQKWLQYGINKVISRSDSVSHTSVVANITSFLGSKVGPTNYNDLHYRNKVFRGVSKDLLIEYDVYQPYLENAALSDFCPDFEKALSIVRGSISSIKRDRERARRDILLKKYASKIEKGYVDRNVVSRYLVRTSNLGWINCDRFIRLEEDEKTDLHFANDSYENQHFLVFKNIKSLIRSVRIGDEVTFRNLPIGEDVRLVSLGVKDKEYYLASQDLTLGSDEKVNLKYEKAKLQDVRKVLESI